MFSDKHEHPGGEQPHAHGGNDQVATHGDGNWDAERNRYRGWWDQRFGSAGRFEDHEADSRYAFEKCRQPEYCGRPWNEVEGDFSRDWQTRHPDRAWNEHREHVRGAWDDSHQIIQLREEELIAHKRMREAGHVTVEKDIVTEHRTMDVPVTREEAYVERRPVERRPSDQPIGTDRERLDVTVREEQVDVQKRPVVYEEVEVGKRTTQETRRVEADVRREVADVEHTGHAGLAGDEPHGHDPRR